LARDARGEEPSASATQPHVPGAAASASSVENAEREAHWHTAPVTLDGRTLLRVRGSASYPAERRAAGIEARIREIAADRDTPAGAIRVFESDDMSLIVAGERRIMAVVEADASVEGLRRQRLANLHRDAIAEAVTRYRRDREPRALLMSTAYSLSALAALAAALLALRWLFRRLVTGLELRYRARVHDLGIQSFRLVRAEQLWRGLRSGWSFLHLLAVLVLAYLCLQFILSQYPATRVFGERLLSLVLGPLGSIGSSLLSALPSLVFLAVLAVVTRYLLRLLHLFFAAVEHGTVVLRDFDREWAMPTYRIVRLLVVAFAVVVAYPYIPGSESAAFKGVSIFLGVMFSLGSTSVIGNIIAGYTMTYRRAFRVGDRIQVEGLIGDVTQIRLQVTHLRSPKNEEIVVPNSILLNGNVINYSTLARERGLILHTTVGIGYETPWRQVEAMLLMAAQRTAGLLPEPPPFVLQKALGDFCITYELNIFCDTPSSMARLYSELHRNILDVFNEYGVQIMTPAYEGDPERPKVVPKDSWFLAPARAGASLPGEAQRRPESSG
jgi:small-conductance mechanosensitive channel